jgi:hypothetical protein
MLASLFDEEVSIVDDDTDKSLVTQDVSTLRVSQFTIDEFAQATVLAFFVDFTEIVKVDAVGHGVKHSLAIAAIRVVFDTETDSVRYVGCVFARNGKRLLREDRDSSMLNSICKRPQNKILFFYTGLFKIYDFSLCFLSISGFSIRL